MGQDPGTLGFGRRLLIVLGKSDAVSFKVS
jgi:hypothetical protein